MTRRTRPHQDPAAASGQNPAVDHGQSSPRKNATSRRLNKKNLQRQSSATAPMVPGLDTSTARQASEPVAPGVTVQGVEGVEGPAEPVPAEPVSNPSLSVAVPDLPQPEPAAAAIPAAPEPRPAETPAASAEPARTEAARETSVAMDHDTAGTAAQGIAETAADLPDEAAAAQQEALRQLAEQNQALQQQLAALSQQATQQQRALIQVRSERDIHEVRRHEGQQSVEELQEELVRSQHALEDMRLRLQKLQQDAEKARQKASNAKKTLSFQLGNALIESTKSVEGLLKLPRRLWTIHQQSQQRKKAPPAPGPVARRTQPALPLQPLTTAVEQNRAAAIAAAAHQKFKLGFGFGDDTFYRDITRLRIATIMDEFTFSSFAPEANLLQLTPQFWSRELEVFEPQLLMVESAWRGKDDQWGNKVGHRSQEVLDIVAWCRQRNIPTVFWNKEDPVHFGTFINTARLFDHVFTTDVDCVPRYKHLLGHDRVYLMPFAAQLSVHNPVEKYLRKPAFCFAGAYYVKYPERTRDLESMLAYLPNFRPVDIYDRNYGGTHPDYQFPPQYQPFIVGNLKYHEIDKAYKGYEWGINLNSIKQSQSMFARRVFELLACNTLVVSNYARGLQLMFGDLVLASDSGQHLLQRLQALEAADALPRVRALALREVLRHHTYQDRLAQVVSRILQKDAPAKGPQVVVLSRVKHTEQLSHVLAQFAQQTHARRRLVLVGEPGLQPESLPEQVRWLDLNASQDVMLHELATGPYWLAVMVPDDHYAAHYLEDLALATLYAHTPVVGKGSRFVWVQSQQQVMQQHADQAYRPVDQLPARCSLKSSEALESMSVRDWIRDLYKKTYPETGLAIDPYNYCLNGQGLTAVQQQQVDSGLALDTGVGFTRLQQFADQLSIDGFSQGGEGRLLGVDVLQALFPRVRKQSRVTCAVTAGQMVFNSTLADGQHEYWYATRDLLPEELDVRDRQLCLNLQTRIGLNIQLAVLFLDAQGERLGHTVQPGNANIAVTLPEQTARIRLGLRFYAAGEAAVEGLLLGKKLPLVPRLISATQTLLVTNQYPSYGDLYRNAFVHTRARLYREQGQPVDVFRTNGGAGLEFAEFEQVNVMAGNTDVLAQVVAQGQYRQVLVHFLSEAIWQALEPQLAHTRVTVWVHGFEVQAYARRAFVYDSDEQHSKARQDSERRMAFWRRVMQHPSPNLKLVFVSEYLAQCAMADVGVSLPFSRYVVIHNPIDTDTFRHLPKPATQRTRILSIRPYASRIYANDLTVAAILALSAQPFFHELEFRLIGDGPLFEQVTAPVQQFANVILERKFLTRTEIAALHREYGIFLCPTRMDTQGVSRDEAMASGLVPVTTAVAAVPEFVDADSGLVVPGEDPQALAQAIIRLYQHPEEFLRLSAGAAARVRQQSGQQQVIAQELMQIRG